MADIYLAIAGSASSLRQSPGLWVAGVPAGAALLGCLAGFFITCITVSHAHAPFLRAQPLSTGARRRMAAIAAACLGIPIFLLVGGAVAMVADVVSTGRVFVQGMIASAVCAAGFGGGIATGLWLAQPADSGPGEPAAPIVAERMRFSIARLDRGRPPWMTAWAWSLPLGLMTVRLGGVIIALLFGFVAFLAIGSSIGQGRAGPAVVAGTLGGLLAFVLSLRCDPLASPVLRASSLRFEQAIRRLVRLPLALSLAFFALLAGPAFATEPAAWAMPVSGGLGLLILDAVYAVFAVYFVSRRLLAAFAFLSALALTAYESLEYGRPVGLGLLALLIWLWYRARQRYRHG